MLVDLGLRDAVGELAFPPSRRHFRAIVQVSRSISLPDEFTYFVEGNLRSEEQARVPPDRFNQLRRRGACAR